MPAITVEIRRTYPRDAEIALLAAVHAAVQEALRLPPHDRTARLVVHEPHRFAASPALAHPDRATLVSIDLFAGRSLDAKRALYRGVVATLAAFDIPADHVTIVLREAARECWGVRGGQAACDVDLGFRVEV